MNFHFVSSGTIVLLIGVFHASSQVFPEMCESSEMRCERTPKCIKKRFRCDSDLDCGLYDDSDERNCLVHEHCADDDYDKCDTGYCLHYLKFCDGVKDCPGNDHSDEANCTCGAGEARCLDPRRHQCVLEDEICDGNVDCVDGSDESEVVCGQHQCTGASFKCKQSHRCISAQKICNEQNDCGPPDVSDEDWTLCPCDNTPPRTFCLCPPGYYNHYSHNGHQTCIDIDECGFDDVCHHVCHNFNGSHACSCHQGYALKSDNKSCTLDSPSLLYEWRSVIMIASLDFTSLDPAVAFPNVTSFDVDSHTGTVFWTSATDGLIGSRKISKEKSDSEHKVLFKDLMKPTLIAFDWISNNFFFVAETTGAPVLMICNAKEYERRRCATLYTLVGENITITEMAVAPQHGLVFWTQTSISIPKNSSSSITEGSIWSGRMDGLNITLLAKQMVRNPVGIAIDHVFHRIFWIDSLTRTIESMSFDGSSRTITIEMKNRVWGTVRGLTVFEDQVLWIENDAMYRCTISLRHQNLLSRLPTNCMSVHKPFLSNATFPRILHPVLQPKGGDSPCDSSPCSFICTSDGTTQSNKENGYKCICPDSSSGIKEEENNADCLRRNVITTSNVTQTSWKTQPKLKFKLSTTMATTTISSKPRNVSVDKATAHELISDNFTAFFLNKSTANRITDSVKANLNTNDVYLTNNDNAMGDQTSCECITSASGMALTVLMVTVAIISVQGVICLFILKRRKRIEKTNEHLNLIRSYIELQTHSGGFPTVAVPGEELLDFKRDENREM